MKTLNVADMFAGCGGTSTGIVQAAESMGLKVKLTAINSWPTAIETHSANHPGAIHICKNVMAVDPLKIGHKKNRLHILVASPECKWHSKARGDKPINDQLRISAWDVVRFTGELMPWVLVVENVTEFEKWGPIDSRGRPIKSEAGKIFDSWLNAIAAFGYKIEKRVLRSADYGDPTIRQRLFIIAYRNKKMDIQWPVPTHSRCGEDGLKPWVPAAHIINWNRPSRSIFDPSRHRPLVENTIKRIRAGVEKYYGDMAPPFLQFIDQGLACRKTGEEMVLPMPIPGFVIPQHAWDKHRHPDSPAPTITTTSRGVGIAQPVAVVPNRGERQGQKPRSHDVNEPMPSVTTVKGHGVVQSLMVQFAHKDGVERRVKPIDSSVPTITTKAEWGIMQPMVVHSQHQGNDEHRIKPAASSPAPTITTKRGLGVVEPFLSLYYSSGGQTGNINNPTPTITCEDRISLVEPRVEGMCFDILYRMFDNSELAAAMGFPEDYIFKGTSTEQTKQIGNAVTVGKARAIAKAQIRMILSNR